MFSFIRNIFRRGRPASKSIVQYETRDKKDISEDFEDNPLYLFKLQEDLEVIKNIKFIYCLVGNVIKVKTSLAEENLQGTKHFSLGTKVYCYPTQWGDGYEKIKVIGLHRKSKKLITIVIASKIISNWRLKTVYNPYIIKEMLENSGWTDKESDKKNIIELAAALNKRKI